MTRTEKENLVPVWERITISLEEAAAYSGIGVRKLRDMTDKPECNYVIWVGIRRMIKRKKFDEYLESAYSVYLKNQDGQFVGEIAYHYDDEIQHEIANVIIYSKYRKNGYGSEALDLLCSMAKNNGVSLLYDDMAIDNPAITLFLKHGFAEDSRTEEKIILKKKL